MHDRVASDATSALRWRNYPPGWVRTDMGGPNARLSIEESIPNLVATVNAQRGKRGLQYLDYLGQTVPW
jgi:hypothetical protein